MKRNQFVSLFMLMFVLLMSSVASAAPTLVSGGLGSLGEIERITLNDPADVYSGGIMVVGGVEMILPKNLLIDLPANRLSLQQIFDQAPAACKAQNPPETGLAKADKCNGSSTGGIATMHAVRTNAGNVIIGDLFIQKAAELVVGVVSYINYDQGYYRVNGLTGDPATGAMVRLNDPESRHTIQSGPGCAGGPNCSPDPRFALDKDNYTNTFATGYPVCIPSTVQRTFTNPLGSGGTTSQANANGTGDFLCPDTNRTAALTEPPVADSRRFAPVKVGDSVTAEGNYESVGGVRFLSAHTSTVQKALSTSNAQGQPDYLFLEEVDIEAPAFQNQRQIAMFIGFTTFAPTDVDIWSLHRDPVSNATHEFPLASVQGCDNAQGGLGNCSAQGIVNGPANTNIFKIIYRDDYLKAFDPKLSPCAHLRASPRFAGTGVCASGANIANDFAVLSPIPHEIIARTGRKIDSATNPAIGQLITIDIRGNVATNGEYLFPLGLNLGGIGVAEMSEIDLNLTNTPTIFDGIPWTLDRRLGPSGCLNGGVCEPGAVGSAAFALDPFPFSGLDPRTQASLLPTGPYSNPVFSPGTLTSVRDRIFSYVTGAGIFNGNATLLPCATGVFPANCPADPPLIAINPTPALNIFPPVVVCDSATTDAGVPVVISVLANDVPVFGTIDLTSVQIASGPASGTVAVNATTGAITYTPTATFTVGTVSFTYTVANNFASLSLPGTVTVTINHTIPVARNDAAATPPGSSININVIANDTAITPAAINPATIAVNATTGGSAAANLDGTITYTAPAVAGTYTFTYTVQDNAVPSATSNIATVTVAVTPPATMITPANNSTFAGASQTFTWNAATGANRYVVWVGTAPGASDIGVFPAAGTIGTTTTVSGLPTNGIPLYVRLHSRFGTTWYFNDYIYSAAGTLAPATMTSPANTSTLAGASQTFTWNAAAGANRYAIWVGTTPGANNIGVFPAAGTTGTTTTVTGLPTNGSTLYVRLNTRFGLTWYFTDFTYTAAGTPPPATMLSPINASTLTGASTTFTWNNAGANRYAVWVGTTLGSNNLGIFPAAGTTGTTTTVTGLPANGTPIFIRLNSRFGTTWFYNDFTYTSGP